MEADGVVEGFSKSIELHGLKFNKLIGKLIIIIMIHFDVIYVFTFYTLTYQTYINIIYRRWGQQRYETTSGNTTIWTKLFYRKNRM